MSTNDAVTMFLTYLKAKNRKPTTITWYKSILNKFAGMYSELPLTPGDCEKFIMSCMAGDERMHGYYRALRAFYGFLKRRLKLPYNPMMEDVDPPGREKKQPRPLTPDQLRQLLTFPHPSRTMAMLLFLADTGARLSEIRSLNDNSFFETEYGIVASITGKTGRRIVPISRQTYTAIRAIIPVKIGSNRMSKVISNAFKDAHVPGSAINLRHTFGTLWEGNEDTLQVIMGHTEYKTTLRYRELRTKVICSQHAIYSPLKLLPATRQMI